MKNLNDTKNLIIAITTAVVVAGAITFIIVRAIKKKKLENATDLVKNFPNPSSVVQATNNKPNPENYYSVYDTKNFVLNQLGLSIAKTLERELFARFHTDDSTVLGALSQLKTKSDFGAIQREFDVVLSPEHDGQSLITKMASELSTDNNAKALGLIDKLALTIK